MSLTLVSPSLENPKGFPKVASKCDLAPVPGLSSFSLPRMGWFDGDGMIKDGCKRLSHKKAEILDYRGVECICGRGSFKLQGQNWTGG